MKMSIQFCISIFILVILISPDTATAEFGCRLNSDCPAGKLCEDGSCVDDPVCTGSPTPCWCPGVVCPTGSVCFPNQSNYCYVPDCLGDLDCQLGEVCDGGYCLVDVFADRDRDGVPDNTDNCPNVVNTDQDDLDDDGQGDKCDDDDDGDGIPDQSDNCLETSNPSQRDFDNNGVGDLCELNHPQVTVSANCSAFLSGLPALDTDGDDILDHCDKCPFLASAHNFDSDNDGFGDACDPDKDGDGIRNVEDNCPGVPNVDQLDCNCNGMGDDCDALACDASYCSFL